MARKDADQIIAEIARAVAAAAEDDFNRQIERVRELIESPIELVLFAAMVAEHKSWALDAWWFMDHREKSFEDMNKYWAYAPGGVQEEGVYVWPQANVGAYRADFLLICRYYGVTHLFVIECDGHEHHERTKEQASRDKSRDRWFTSRGFKMLRFTGSEIWRDPAACFEEIANAIQNAVLFPGEER